MKKWIKGVLVLVVIIFASGCMYDKSSNDSDQNISGKQLEEYNRLAKDAFTNGTDVYIK